VRRAVARAAGHLGIDGAVSAAIATRLWSGLAGIVTLVAIARFLDPVEQGFYYAFWSLIALQSFAELGMLVVVVAVASHDWARLSLDDRGALAGPPAHVARLVALARFVAAWFSVLAIVFVVVAGLAGLVFLGRSEYPGMSWRTPWIATIVLSGLILLLNAGLALLEGCNQVRSVNRLRLGQAVISSAVLWAALYLGYGLWSIPAMLATSAATGLGFVSWRYRRFLGSIAAHRGASTFSWRSDIWPMQWPLALQGAAAYFMYSLIVPVTFEFSGAEAAGRIGMALQIGMAIGGIASTWLTVKMPRMGMHFARGQFGEFESLWRRSSTASVVAVAAGSVAIAVAAILIEDAGTPIAARLPSLADLLLVMAWICCGQVMLCMATYWRAMKRELTGPWGAIPGVVTGAAVWLGGRLAGTTGSVLGALAVALFLTLPLGLLYFRRARSLANSCAEGASE
jgi:hypothetical protein